jgi:hypothetical protein
MTKLKALGFDLNTDLSVVTTANQNAIILNEAVGAVLQATGGTNAAVITALIANVSNLDATVTPTATLIINAVTAGATLSGYNAVVTTAATGASVLQPGPLPGPPEPTPPTPGSNLDVSVSGAVRP